MDSDKQEKIDTNIDELIEHHKSRIEILSMMKEMLNNKTMEGYLKNYEKELDI